MSPGSIATQSYGQFGGFGTGSKSGGGNLMPLPPYGEQSLVGFSRYGVKQPVKISWAGSRPSSQSSPWLRLPGPLAKRRRIGRFPTRPASRVGGRPTEI